jgi:predicted metal-dependent hydrolase
VIRVDGLAVELRRKKMVNLRLHVAPDGLIWLSMPLRASHREAQAMVRRHRAWLDERLARATAPPDPPLLWGEPVPPGVRGAALERLYRAELGRTAAELAARWIPLVGRRPSHWTLRWMTSRWGSCNSRTGRVTLSLALAALPVQLVEQVLVHELVHLVEPNHGPGFRAQMDRLLPDWRARRAAMRAFKPMVRPRDDKLVGRERQ